MFAKNLRTVGALALAAIALQTIPIVDAQGAETTNVSIVEPHLKTRHRTVNIDGVKIFYREAGDPNAPTILLLHGFPASSHMFRDLIPALADRFHVVAPDYPGFGYSDFPDPKSFDYTFQSYAELIDKFATELSLSRYALYMQDYGAPVGLRLALLKPERVSALLVQNGNAYKAGLGDSLAAVAKFWKDPSPANRDTLRQWLKEGPKTHYTGGLEQKQIELLSPDSWTLDWERMSRPGNIELQLDLFYDYRTNVDLYPQFHEYFRKHQPPTLVTWGRHDEIFIAPGAHAYKNDLPDAEVHLLDAGHFALESHWREIAALIRDFMARKVSPGKSTN